MRTIPSVGDWGTIIYVQITDEDGTPQDPAAASAIVATVTKPDGTDLPAPITLVASTDADDHPPADGWTQFTVPDQTPVWLDQDGLWRVRPRYTITGVGSWRSSRPGTFQVAP